MLANRTDAAGNPSFDAGFDAIIDNLREDGKKAKEAADAFKARGGTITYRQGDAANYAEAPAGTDVVAVCDPPYYLTAGYNGQVSVPIDANGMGWDYKTTRRMLDGLVDKGDAIVYTDEAWWFKETYTPDQQEDLFGGGSPFAQEQEILLGIINALDHFDVAGRVVGRQEVLGINHGHKTTDGRAEGVAGTPRGAGATAEGAADGRGVQGNHPGDALEGLAAGAEGQNADLLGDGAGRGREGDAESVALAREIAAVQIEEAAADAGVQVTPKVANIIRSSVRQVREKHILDYAKTVSKNAKAWIKRQEKALDQQMAAQGYTEKVWHGTGVEDFDVFRLATREEPGSKPGAIGADKDIKMAFFSYQETTAENYAALSSYDIDTDYETLTHGATPNVRQYYVNKGKCLEIDEANWPMNYQAWTETLRNAHADGCNSVLCRNAVDDQGARLPRKEGDPMEWLDYEGTNEAGSEYDGEAGGFKSDILVVFDQPNDPGANRIKASDPVTFWDEKHGELPIPPEMRGNSSLADIRYSVRTAWTPDFPKATCMTTRASLMAKHGELFNKAKAGGIRAATELVKDVVKPDKVSAIAAEHPNAIVVPAHAEEARGRNKLPIAYAKYICTTTGLDYEDGIVQSVRAHHTGADAEHRLFVNPVFVGAVRRGREYIIVDDHITQGGTVNALRDHIESRGGKVVAVTSLTLSQGSSILSPRKETIDEIKQKWPDIDDLLRAAGIAERADALTESQLKYIAKFSADTFRDRVASAGREGSFGVLRQGVRAPQGYAGTEEDRQVAAPETPAEREAMRHSLMVGIKGADPVTFLDELPIPPEMRGNSSLADIRYSVRTAPPPRKTGIGYKVFYQKNGKLYPPMVANPGGADTPVGIWLDADAAPVAGTSKTGRPQVKQGGKGTQGGSGMLAYRPGWHLGQIPYALQFNRGDENGERTLFPADFVWAEVEYAADKQLYFSSDDFQEGFRVSGGGR